MYNVHGSFNCDDADLMFELERVLKIQNIASVEGYFKGTMYYTRGRIMTLDPADAYPDEYEDDRFLEELTCYTQDGKTIDFNLSDGDALELAQEVLEEVIYGTEVMPLRERREPYEW
jgi:hypothetical protein